MFHEYHLLFQNPPHAPQFQNCRSLNHDSVDDVKIHICIWDAFMAVYSVIEAFTALQFAAQA